MKINKSKLDSLGVNRSRLGKLSRNKGKGFERRTANDLKPYYGEGVHRGYQSRSGQEAPDVDGTPFWIECKCGKRTNPRKALEQAIEATDGRMPIAVCHDDRKETVVMLRWSDFLTLITDINK